MWDHLEHHRQKRAENRLYMWTIWSTSDQIWSFDLEWNNIHFLQLIKINWTLLYMLQWKLGHFFACYNENLGTLLHATMKIKLAFCIVCRLSLLYLMMQVFWGFCRRPPPNSFSLTCVPYLNQRKSWYKKKFEFCKYWHSHVKNTKSKQSHGF